MSTEFNEMQQLKRTLFAMRNGVVADTLRKAGCPHRIVFGLNLPQLNEIAASMTPSADLAERLRADVNLRESALLAPMLYPVAELTYEKARQWALTTMWHEDADILCFKLLRHTPFAGRLAAELCAAPDSAPLARYTGLRLYFNLVSKFPADALGAARSELQRPQPLSTLASMLAEEAAFLTDTHTDSTESDMPHRP